MANKRLFAQTRQLPIATAKNAAGATAYSLTDAEALCQYVATGTFGSTFYASEQDEYARIQAIVANVDSTTIAKAAVYGREKANMKDTPAYLLAVLAARGETKLLTKVFSRVVTNVKMLLNFVQIVRSGATGRRSFGTAVKRLIQAWFYNKTGNQLFIASIGHSNPSLADVIKMVHPRPLNAEMDLVFKYILDKDISELDSDNLPSKLEAFLDFKADTSNPVPEIPFMALTNFGLSKQQWEQVAEDMPWNTLRMNLNNLARKGVFENMTLVRKVAAKLADADEVRKNAVFPYQLLTAYQNTTEVPQQIRNALQDALEVATENTPVLNGNILVSVDVSGSMSWAATGMRGSVTSVTKCVDVAALFASCILRNNQGAEITAFDTRYHGRTNLNPRDSVMTNATILSKFGGGGTAIQLPLQNAANGKDVIILVSDNESWSGNRLGEATPLMQAWTAYKRRNPKCKLVLIDIQPGNTSQVAPSVKDVLCVGGFSDAVFDVIARFVNNTSDKFVDVVKSTEL